MVTSGSQQTRTDASSMNIATLMKIISPESQSAPSSTGKNLSFDPFDFDTLLAKKLCDSSFVGKHLELIHPHFNMYGFWSYLFFVHYKVVCWLVWCVFWC